MLKQAIVDAKTLKEAAFKIAEDSLLDKYSLQIKEAVNVILEQDDPAEDEELGDMFGAAGAGADQGRGVADDDINLPLAVTDGEQLCACPDEGEEIEIDFDALEQQMRDDGFQGEDTIGHEELAGELGLEDGSDEELDLDEQALAEMLADGNEPPNGGSGGEELEESSGISADFYKNGFPQTGDHYLDKRENVFTVKSADGMEVEFFLAVQGDAGKVHSAPTKVFMNSFKKQPEVPQLTSKVTESIGVAQIKKIVLTETKKIEGKLLNENKKLLSEKKSLIKENKDLKDRSDKFKSKVVELSEVLQDINLTNARLLYTNEVLKSISLNERQKEKIAEAISRTGSVDEARAVYEALIDSVGTPAKTRKPKSLSEELNKQKSMFARSSQRKIANHPDSQRWKALAGIKE